MLIAAARTRRILASPAASGILRIVSSATLGCASGADGVLLPRLLDGVPASPSTPSHSTGVSSSSSSAFHSPAITSQQRNERSMLYHLATAHLSEATDVDHPTEAVEEQYQKMLKSVEAKTMPPNAWLWSMTSSCSTKDDIKLLFQILQKLRVFRLSNLRINANFSDHLCMKVTEACARVGALDYGLKALWKHNVYGITPTIGSAHYLLQHAKEHNDIKLMESIMQVLRRNSLPLQPGTADIVFSICYNARRWDLLSKYAERFVKDGVKLHRMEFAAKIGYSQVIWRINNLRDKYIKHYTIATGVASAELAIEHGEGDGMLAISARSRRLVLPKVKGILPHLHSRGFCTTSLPSQSSRKFFTATSQGCCVVDTAGYTSLKQLLSSALDLCLFNSASKSGNYRFSDLFVGILKQLAIISFQNALNGKKFSFDVKEILVKRSGYILLNVLVPESQLISVNEESIYKDCIIGPLAHLVYSLHIRWTSLKSPIKNTTYKEILDLLEQAQNGIWWMTLEDILKHPLFWSVEENLAAIACSYQWMAPPKNPMFHGIPYVKAKNRRIRPEKFIHEFAKQFFYWKEYTVNKTDSGEYEVKSNSAYKDWRQEFIAAKMFGKNYKGFGIVKPKADLKKEAVDCEEFVRHLCMHFGDENFEAFKNKLDKRTLKAGLIELEQIFSISLTVYHVLRRVNKNKKTNVPKRMDVLDVRY